MKIAKLIGRYRAALLQTAVLLGVTCIPASAQTPVTVPPAAAPVAEAVPVTTPGAVPGTMPGAVPVAVPAAVPMAAPAAPAVMAAPVMQPSLPTAAPSMPAAFPGSAAVTAPPANMPANLPANLPTGTPAVVTQVMGNLQDSQNNVSVEDLSKAQDALTRLDLLLQIEKKIGEIKKTQDDREPSGINGGGMMGSVPASALALPPGLTTAGQGLPGASGGMNGVTNSLVTTSAPSTSGTYEVEQISGTNGSYNAILTTPDGDRKTVRAGDKLDGRTVQSISLGGVQLSAAKGAKKGGKTLSIHNDGVLLTPMVR